MKNHVILSRQVIGLTAVTFLVSLASAEPALPAGLGTPEAPKPAPEPLLPAGLEMTPRAPAHLAVPSARLMPDSVTGFWEFRGGVRTQDDPHEKTASIGESRLQLQYEMTGEHTAVKIVSDFLYDPVADDNEIDLENGDGWMDLRQASLLLRPASFMDLKIGRQINTWGTGDLLFINDLFPKDWNSFFIGRDDEYLKAPSDAAKLSLFSDAANLDIVYTPRFDSDRYIDGRRISYWNSAQGRSTGQDAEVDADQPDDTFQDDEWAGRLYRNVGAYEIAGYGYTGFWKSPAGQNPDTGQATFPRLQVIGATARGPVASGIMSLEGGWYRSADDLDGDNPYIRNSEARGLVGYEQELVPNLTGGVQYYVENILDYAAYRAALPAGTTASDEYRQVATIRLTKFLMNQNLRISLFLFYSPTDHDAYLRPNANYKINDYWIAEIGGNLFIGEKDESFFGQFEDANNIYASLRYGF